MYVDHPNHEEKLRAADGITLQPGYNDDDDSDDDNDYDDGIDDGAGGFDGGGDDDDDGFDDVDNTDDSDDNEFDNHRFQFISLCFYYVEVLTRWSFSSIVQILDGDLGRGAAVFGRDPIMLEVFAKGML